ncbi:DNA-directed RNA polymerase subunit alpha [Candidatus Omnitrophus magneticus]|uniref:DNA-directed RNA polymerase subunit alpha n=1 Tax=Candidatus Omnitrophus magneticus TaxID=1609969 RepID=A0A0F0CQR2_9BACT|nr:DNA-directed RNA polymerase subunit alpha [Candidatus Omnitrophus magneticus]
MTVEKIGGLLEMGFKLKNFELPKKIDFEQETYSPLYGKIIAEPFEKGYGVTIGNSLRRVLLSSIEGTAVTKIKFGTVVHEFSVIQGVLEDVPEIILNIKNLVLKSHFKEPKPMFISMSKKGPIKAKDLKVDETVEIVNPEQHIATLTEDVKFEMELIVERGFGYVPAERHRAVEEPIGIISIDALFSPVKKVNMNVVETRVGHLTDYDKLILEIFTNGSMEPKDTILYAANILHRHLDVFLSIGKLPEEVEDEQDDERERDVLLKKLAKPISELELSVRSSNCLAEANIKTIGDLVYKKEADMLKYKNFGKKSLTEINDILVSMGLELGMELDEDILKNKE